MKTWFRNRSNKNEKPDNEFNKKTMTAEQDFGGDLNILQFESNTGLVAHSR